MFLNWIVSHVVVLLSAEHNADVRFTVSQVGAKLAALDAD